MATTDDSIKKNISQNITKYREKSGLSQKELASRLHTTPSRVSNWEQGANCPTIDMLFDVCKILNVSINDIYGVYPETNMKLSYEERQCLEKYRNLDDHGRQTVDIILDRETTRTKAAKEKEELVEKLRNRISKKEIIYSSEENPQLLMVAEPITPYGTVSRVMKTYIYLRKIACAGTGFYFDDIPTETLEAPYLEGADFIIGVSGDSMEPDYFDGDMLYVKKVENLNCGDVGIFTINNECFLKEYGQDGLLSRNNRYNDIPGNEDVRLIGKVIGKVPTD